MTIIGKILTFLIFFMSLVFLGFAISINALNKDPKSHKSWYEVAIEYQKKHIPEMQKDLEAKDKVIVDHQAEVAKLKKDLEAAKANWTAEVKQARDEAASARADSEKVKQSFKDSQTATEDIIVELNKRREENVALQDTIKKKDLELADMQAKTTKATNDRVQAQEAARTYLDRAKELEKHNRELVREIEDDRQKTTERTPGATTQQVIDRRPPPDDVRGTIKSVSPDGLVSITIGSDSGLLRGHTLEVFRTEPKAQYLGVLQIVEVGPHEAVGKLLTPQFKKMVQPNDQVASKILPSR